MKTINTAVAKNIVKEEEYQAIHSIVSNYNPEVSASSIMITREGVPSITIDERIFQGFTHIDVRYEVRRLAFVVIIYDVTNESVITFNKDNITEYDRFIWSKSLQQKISLECLVKLLEHAENCQYGTVYLSFDKVMIPYEDLTDVYGWNDDFIKKFLPDSYRYSMEDFLQEIYIPYELVKEIDVFWNDENEK